MDGIVPIIYVLLCTVEILNIILGLTTIYLLKKEKAVGAHKLSKLNMLIALFNSVLYLFSKETIIGNNYFSFILMITIVALALVLIRTRKLASVGCV
jgi:hypothetical protein